MATRFILSFSLSCLAATVTHARMGDVTCDDSARLTETLKVELHAELQGSGLRDPETMLQVWVTPRSGDWLIVQNYANGTSCIVAMGEYWEDTKPEGKLKS